MHVCERLIFVVICQAVLITGALADEVRVAVAANFAATMDVLASRFETASGHTMLVSSGSTGGHYAQITSGAPYDAFFAADAERPQRLERENFAIAGTRFTYAVGKLALWSRQQNYVDAEGRVLDDGKFRFLAIANPDLAPYGAAARQVLKRRNLWNTLRERIVQGQDVTQSYAFVHSGSAELGFVAYSQLKRPGVEIEGSYWLVPQSEYTRIEQQAVLLKDLPAAREFLEFVRGPEGITIIGEFGYSQPDEGVAFTDDAGRTVSVPRDVQRVFAAGAPAEVLLYTLAPYRLVGRNHAPKEAALKWMPPEFRAPVLIQNLPERDDPGYDAELIALAPDLYVDYGTVDEDYVSSLEAVQSRTNVPGVIFDGALERIPDTYRRLGALVGERERGERLARESERILAKYKNALAPLRVYLACSADGLLPCLASSSSGEIALWLGAVNVAGTVDTAPPRLATLAEIKAWNPQAIVAPNEEALALWHTDPAWQEIAALRDGKAYAPPALPFSWGARPPSVNRMLGLVWLAYTLSARAPDAEFFADVRGLFAAYYHLDLTNEQIKTLVTSR